MMPPEPFVNATAVAQFLAITRRQVFELARAGKIPAHPLLGTRRKVWRFKLSEVDAVASGTRQHCTPTVMGPWPKSVPNVKCVPAVPAAGRSNPMAKGWFRRKQDKLVYCWYNADGKERSKVVGPSTMTDEEGWLEVGTLGLDKLVNKPDPPKVTFGEVLQHFIAYGKKKTGGDKAYSSKITEGRNARLHLSHWLQHVAKDIEPLEVQEWIDAQSKGLRSKLRSMMSAVYKHGQKFGLLPRTQESNPINWVSAPTVSDYEAVSLSPEESFAILERISVHWYGCS
jgi:predicted DNA-binding transcriptional regulator AlpA